MAVSHKMILQHESSERKVRFKCIVIKVIKRIGLRQTININNDNKYDDDNNNNDNNNNNNNGDIIRFYWIES